MCRSPATGAAAGVAVANLEAVLLTLVLDAPRSDVPSIFTVARPRDGESPDDEAGPGAR